MYICMYYHLLKGNQTNIKIFDNCFTQLRAHHEKGINTALYIYMYYVHIVHIEINIKRCTEKNRDDKMRNERTTNNINRPVKVKIE